MTTSQTNMPRLSWSEVCAHRLDRHALSTPSPDARPADIAAAVCGAHAQIMSAAELSIGLRIAGATRADVRRALWEEHSMTKTFGPRGTVHLLAARDMPMWTGVASALPLSPDPLPEEARLTPEQREQVVAAIAGILAGAELTVDELTEALIDLAGPWAGDPVVPAWYEMWPRWLPALYTAASRGVLCFGPIRGRKVTYTNPQRWLPELQPAEAPVALAWMVRRYLHAYGPATPQQFARWLNVPRLWAAQLFDSLEAQLQQVELEGMPAWLPAGDSILPDAAPEGLRLLPYFDAYVVGSHPREMLFPGPAAERALAGGQAGNYPVLLIDGIVAGVWHQRRSGRKLDITVEPLSPFTAAQRRSLEAQVERIGQILEGTPRLTIGPVTVGPHA